MDVGLGVGDGLVCRCFVCVWCCGVDAPYVYGVAMCLYVYTCVRMCIVLRGCIGVFVCVPQH